jgi:hypothetical protein
LIDDLRTSEVHGRPNAAPTAPLYAPRATRRRGGAIRAWPLVLLLAAACDPYEDALLESQACGNGRVDEGELCDTSKPAGEKGACPTQCPRGDGCTTYELAGDACQRECVASTITRAQNGDRCCPAGLTGAQDTDCATCGDGIVGPLERCDPPESCPTAASCTSRLPCLVLRYHGSPQTCDASCEALPIERCIDSDECCPPGCSNSGDSDCSAQCGDGRLDEERGETCDSSDPDASCAIGCDDGNPCTVDMQLGSPRSCNVACAHMLAQPSVETDGCCLEQASAAADPDCATLFHPSLQHRYRFIGAGSVVRDWAGGVPGTVVGTNLSGEGALELSGGTDGPYVDLPNGLVAGQTSITLEAWVTLHGGAKPPFQRVFDFGANDAGEGQQGQGTAFIYLTASNDDDRPRLVFDSGERNRVSIDGDEAVARETRVHFAATFDGAAHKLALYVNGLQRGRTADVEASISELTDVNNWLGRSQFEQDAELNATLHEFRVYSAALSADQIAASHEAGPDPSGR